MSIRELTEYIQVNHNAVRQHLTVLKGAALVSEEVEARIRPGRLRLLYRIHPEAAGKWQSPGPYAWLAGLLEFGPQPVVESSERGSARGTPNRRREY